MLWEDRGEGRNAFFIEKYHEKACLHLVTMFMQCKKKHKKHKITNK